jgi:hypothetical protein
MGPESIFQYRTFRGEPEVTSSPSLTWGFEQISCDYDMLWLSRVHCLFPAVH